MRPVIGFISLGSQPVCSAPKVSRRIARCGFLGVTVVILTALTGCGLHPIKTATPGKVVEVTSGDTFLFVEPNGTRHSMRLAYAWAPTPEQLFAEESCQALADKVLDQDVQAFPMEYDNFPGSEATDEEGRQLVELQSHGNVVSHEMIREGWAWPRQSFAIGRKEKPPTDDAWESFLLDSLALASEARQSGRGFWAGSSPPIPPWCFPRERESLERLQSADPDFGGGILGYLTYLLWHVFRHLPSTGHWDWLYLVIFVVVTQRILILPFIWRAVRWDMERFARQKSRLNLSVHIVLEGLFEFFLCLFTWLYFCLPPGINFSANRALVGGYYDFRFCGVPAWVGIGMGATSGVILVSLCLRVAALQAVTVNGGSHAPRATIRYGGIVRLYAYGEVLDPESKLNGITVLWCIPAICMVVHAVYLSPGFSTNFRTGLPLMWVILLTQPISVIARMTFAYVLHKRDFG